jgi:probable rRNA maturation factor
VTARSNQIENTPTVGVLNVESTRKTEDNDLIPIITKAIDLVCAGEGRRLKNLNIILTDDAALKVMNKKYLDLDEPTDVLAFDLTDEANGNIEGDIYISLDRAEEQAKLNQEPNRNEVIRLAVHGFLHLSGWDHDDDVSLKSMIDHGERYVQQIIPGK